MPSVSVARGDGRNNFSATESFDGTDTVPPGRIPSTLLPRSARPAPPPPTHTKKNQPSARLLLCVETASKGGTRPRGTDGLGGSETKKKKKKKTGMTHPTHSVRLPLLSLCLATQQELS